MVFKVIPPPLPGINIPASLFTLKPCLCIDISSLCVYMYTYDISLLKIMRITKINKQIIDMLEKCKYKRSTPNKSLEEKTENIRL